MSNPHVCAILLTADRQAYTRRAVRCWLSQTYEHKSLVIIDNGKKPYRAGLTEAEAEHVEYWRDEEPGLTIGTLRNCACTTATDPKSATEQVDIFIHFDSDDWSCPQRIAEQVAHLQASGAEAVGYNEMLFWQTMLVPISDSRATMLDMHVRTAEAWLYKHPRPNYVQGASLCYWRKTWEAKPFPDTSKGGEEAWARGLRVASVSSMGQDHAYAYDLSYSEGAAQFMGSPAMIAEIHGGNTCAKIEPDHKEWTRVPEWDARVAEIMKL